MIKIGLLALLSFTWTLNAAPPSIEQVLEALADQIASTPTTETEYRSPRTDFYPHNGFQYYPGLGAHAVDRPSAGPANETSWQFENKTGIRRIVVDDLLEGRGLYVLGLSEGLDGARARRVVELYRDLYVPIQIRAEAESLALLRTKFEREVYASHPIDVEALWQAYRSGGISDELVAMFANGEAKINGYAARDYLNLRIDLAEKQTGKTVGNLAFHRSLVHLAFGVGLTLKTYPNDTARLMAYVGNVTAIFAGLLDAPPVLPGTWLAILDGAALFVRSVDHTLSEKHPQALATDHLYGALVGRIQALDAAACGLVLEADGLAAQLHSWK